VATSLSTAQPRSLMTLVFRSLHRAPGRRILVQRFTSSWNRSYFSGFRAQEEKDKAYKKSLCNWWSEYRDRKMDEEHEYLADTLLFDKNDLPRMAPAPVEWEEMQQARSGSSGNTTNQSNPDQSTTKNDHQESSK